MTREFQEKEIYEKIVQILSQKCDLDVTNIDSETRIFDDLAMDSINLLTLVSELENHFQYQ